MRRLLALALGERLPQRDGTLRVRGTEGPLHIRRDGFGIPYIEAGSDTDAWFGVGFCHAQDRPGQLEITARAVRGTLAERVGPSALGIDRLSRRIGFARAGAAQVAASDADIQAQLVAYCEGIAAGFAAAGNRGGHVHALLGCPPTRWTPADVQGFLALLSFALAANWDMELLRLQLWARHGEDAVRALDPHWAEWLPTSFPPGAPAGPVVDALRHDLDSLRALWGNLGGSNAWAVAPHRTASGRPLLANDPHLNPSMPAAWYLVHVRTPTWTACGATFTGIPGLGSGHNDHGAWGITAAHCDNTDLWIEQIGPDARSVRQGDRFVPCPTRLERIAVRGARTVIEEVLETPRGPIVTPALGGDAWSLSLSATWLQGRASRGLLDVHRARSFEEFRRRFDQGVVNGASMVWADTDGHIGWVLAARVPRRRGHWGLIPQCGWNPEVGWDPDPVPQDEMPWVQDPDCGFVCTANNLPVPTTEDGPWLGVDFLDGYRQQVLTEQLRGRSDWTVADTARLQLDLHARPWEQLREHLLAIQPRSRRAGLALEWLRPWDGRMDPDSVAATIYVFWFAELWADLCRTVAPSHFHEQLGRGATALLPHNLSVTRRLSHVVQWIASHPEGPGGEPWDARFERALDVAVQKLETRHGRQPHRWQWASVRPTTLTHLLQDVPLVGPLFNLGPIRLGGDASTVAQASVDLAQPDANPVGIATLRTVIDVGEWDRCRFSVVHGQSENPFSPHRDDQLSRWLVAEGVPIWWSSEQIERHIRHSLHLMPVAPAPSPPPRTP
jgi:penicillin amidase